MRTQLLRVITSFVPSGSGSEKVSVMLLPAYIPLADRPPRLAEAEPAVIRRQDVFDVCALGAIPLVVGDYTDD